MEISGYRPVTTPGTRGLSAPEPHNPPARVETPSTRVGTLTPPSYVVDAVDRPNPGQRPGEVAVPVETTPLEREPVQDSSPKPQVDPEMRDAIEVVNDPHGMTRTWWHFAAGDEVREPGQQDRGRVVLVGVQGAQVGDGNSQMNVFVRTIKNPKIDFEVLMKDSRIAAALAELAANPQDVGLRQAAVDALSGVRRSKEDWTTAYAGKGTAILGLGARRLDGTVAVVRSKNVQVGDHHYQENTIVHTVSPDIAATVLLANPDVVNGLIDVACSPGDAPATAEFERAVGSALVADLANSAAARRGHGTVHRPPAAGRTLRVANTAGVSIGKRVSQKTQFAQTAHLGRNLRTSAGQVATGVRRAARRAGTRPKSGTPSAKPRAE
jgi:hypothetical protein